MKILLVVSSYAPNVGGLQTVTGQLARELQHRGNDVTVVTHRYPRSLPHRETIDDVRLIRWLFIAPRLKHLSNFRADLFLAGWFYFPLTLIRLIALLRRTDTPVVNLHFVGAPALFVLVAGWLISFRLVVSLHGDDVEGLRDRTAFDRWVFRSILRRADMVTACSRYLLEQAESVEPCVRDKGSVIHNGIDPLPVLSAKQTEATILAGGRMVPKKGFDVLLEAQARSRGKWRLTLIGDGPEHDRLKILAAKLGLNGDVMFLGGQPRAQILQAMSASELVVIPSRQEPFGMVALEAMAMGRPVVATRVGGLPEVLEGADALLVAPDDPAELANAIETVLERLRNDPQFGVRNRECAAQYSLKRMVDEYETSYQAVD